MADDINSYALNLAFNLQTSPAISGLNDISAIINNIYESVTRVSTAFVAATSNMSSASIQASNIASAMSSVSSSASDISSKAIAISDGMSNISEAALNMSSNISKSVSDLGVMQKQYKEIDRLHTSMSKTDLKSFTNFDKLRKWMPLFLKDNKLLSSESKNQSTSAQDMGGTWASLYNTGSRMLRQGKEYAGVGNTVAAAWTSAANASSGAASQGKSHLSVANTVAAVWTSMKKSVADTVKGFASMLVGIQAIKSAIVSYTEDQERFVTANYRIYGSQYEVVKQVNNTASKYNLLKKEALAAYEALGDGIRTTKEELGLLAATNGIYSRVLGVNNKDMGVWQRSMRAIGASVHEADALLARYNYAMYKLGISTQQMSHMITKQADAANMMAVVWGKDGTIAIDKHATVLGALGTQMGMNEQQVGKLHDALIDMSTDSSFVTGMQSLGHLMEDELDLSQEKKDVLLYQRGLNDFLATQFKDMEQLDGRAKAMRYAAMKDKMHTDEAGIDAMYKIWKQGEIDKQAYLGMSGEEILKITKSNNAEIQKLIDKGMSAEMFRRDQHRKATENAGRRLTEAWQKVNMAIENVIIALTPIIMWFVDNVLVPAMEYTAKIINLVSGFVSATDSATDSLKDLSATPTVGWLDKVFKFLYSIGGVLGFVTAGFIALGAAIAGIAGALVAWWVFMRITNTVKLLAIAAAALSVGFAILSVASAISTLASIDTWKLWSAIAALAVVFGILALAVWGMSTGAGAVAAFALAVVLLMIAKAAEMAANAVYVLAQSFVLITDSVVKLMEASGGGLGLIGWGASLTIFGVELLAAAFTIGAGASAFSIAMVPLLAAFGLFSAAMFMISDSAIEKAEKLGGGGVLSSFGSALSSISPGISAFISSMGTGGYFASGMYSLSTGIDWIDPNKTAAASGALSRIGASLEQIAKIDSSRLSTVSSAIKDFASSISEIQIQDAIVTTFNDLMAVIPTIQLVTDAIASAIESGQDKIKNQITSLKESFVVLEEMSNKLGTQTSMTSNDENKKVMAETISTVQVKTQSTGTGKGDNQNTQATQLELMATIAEHIETIMNSNDVNVIKSLLQSYLPKISESPSKLGTRMNSW